MKRLVLLLVVSTLALVGPAQALNPRQVGPRDPLQRGFPAYYTDDAGVELQLCDDGSSRCLLARPRDLAPPEGEQLYWAAFGELRSPGVNLSVEFAVEAAWLGREQVVFDRLRVRGHVNRAGTYRLTHPYGTVRLRARNPAEQRNIDFTQDVGCEPPPGGRCNFALLASSPRAHITTWLRQTNAPRGYLGNPERPSTVTGGLRQTMTVIGPAGRATTNRFGVLGKRAGQRAVSLPRRLRFGNVRRARAQRVRVLNIGTRPLRLGRIRLRGERTLRRFATDNPCGRGDVLRVGRGCTVGIRYRPDGRRRSTARLRIPDDTPVGVRVVRVRATTAAVFSTRTERVRFKPLRANRTSRTRRIVVRNTGSVPLKVRRVSIAGRNRGSFEKRSGSPRVCARGAVVPAGGLCAIYVGFDPLTFGTKRARIVVRSNSLRAPHTVGLFGRAR